MMETLIACKILRLSAALGGGANSGRCGRVLSLWFNPHQAQIRYRGVPIGEVTTIELSEDQEYVVVNARLRQSAASIAKDGSVFWIVRPELGFGTISGLSTVITGPYIQVLPGTGKAKAEFVGLDRPPPALERKGLKLLWPPSISDPCGPVRRCIIAASRSAR